MIRGVTNDASLNVFPLYKFGNMLRSKWSHLVTCHYEIKSKSQQGSSFRVTVETVSLSNGQ